MASAKGVILTLVTAGKAGQSFILSESGEAVSPASKHFMDVGLMAYILYNPISWAIKHPVQG